MSKLQQILFLLFGRGFNVLLSLLFLPYLARALDMVDYGSYGQTLLVVEIFKAILTCGSAQIIYVYFSKQKDQEGSILNSNLFILFLLSVFGTVVTYFGAEPIAEVFGNKTIAPLLRLHSWSLLAHLPIVVLVSALVYFERTRSFTIALVVLNILKIGLLLVAVQIYESLELIFYFLNIVLVIQALVYYFLLPKEKRLGKVSLRLGYEQIKDGIPLGLTGLLGFAIIYTDSTMISALTTTEDYAIYRNGAIELPFVATIYLSIATIVLPQVTKLFAKEKFDEIVRLKRKVITSTVAIVYPILIFFTFFSYDVIILYMSEKYVGSVYVFAIFNLTLLMRINDYLDVLIAANKGRLILYIHLFSFALNLVLNFILIEFWGSLGAAMSTVFSLLLYAAILLYYSAKELKVSVWAFFEVSKILKVVFLSLAASGILFLVRQQFDSTLMFVVLASIYFPIVYLVIFRLQLVDTLVTRFIAKKVPFLRKIIGVDAESLAD